MKIGILDIQGSVEEHFAALQKLQKISQKKSTGKIFEIILVKKKEDLTGLNALIMPGGESTTIGKLLRRFDLRNEIIKSVKRGMTLWGTCAGAILMAKKISGEQQADSLNLMDIEIERNAYGRQLDSFETEIYFKTKKIPAVFIRAPKIKSVGKDTEILAEYNNEIVAVRQGKMLVTTFHPEMTDDLTVYTDLLGTLK